MREYVFNANEVADKLVLWLKEYFDNNGKPLNAVVGCSGGKDSTVVLAALVKAIGPERVYAVLMPNGVQVDLDDSYKVCELLGLKPYLCNIENVYNSMLKNVTEHVNVSTQTKINLAPMLRMTTLKAFSQSVNGRFACNGNASELYLGWFTMGGDDQGQVRPLINLTATEVSLVGKALGLPDWAVFKTPTDGLCGQTDEDKFGFSYSVLDKFIRTGECDDPAIKERIQKMHSTNLFKVGPVPAFNPFEPEYNPTDFAG